MKLLVAMVMALMLAGCAALSTGERSAKLPVQYGTMKLIEQSDSIDGADVVAHVERIRGVIEDDAEIGLIDLVEEVRGPIDWDSLDPSDRMLLDALIAEIEYSVETADLVDDERRVRILQLLDWVEQAASMS